jgi:uncharacterized protein (DUF2235 family)
LGEQDEIILIGFSRGAFAVRSVAAFITEIGLLRKTGLNYLTKLYRLWSKQRKMDVPPEEIFTISASRPSKEISHTSSLPSLRAEISRAESLESLQRRLCKDGWLQRDVRIKVCAVWDTVGSLGLPMPGPIPQKTSKRLCFVDSTLPEKIEFAIQALALNERRKHFQPTIWQDNGVTELKQCWFLGAHSNVGGGYEDTGLANLALVWFIAQLEKYICFDHAALLQMSSSHRTAGESVAIKEFRTSSIKSAVGPASSGHPSSDAPLSDDPSSEPTRMQRAKGSLKTVNSCVILVC